MAEPGERRVVELLLSPRGHHTASVVVAVGASGANSCGVQQRSVWRVGLWMGLFMACFLRVGCISRRRVACPVAVVCGVRRCRADGVVWVARVVDLCVQVPGGRGGHLVARRSVLGVLLLVQEELPLVELALQLVHGRRRKRCSWRRVMDRTGLG